MTYLVTASSLIADYAYYLRFGYELPATKENLNWAIQQPKEEMLKYKFKERDFFYSIMEFAVKTGDVSYVRTLALFGADMDFSPMAFGHIIFFYMDCLQEDRPPNLEMLEFLLSKMKDVNEADGGYFQTSLERALERMSHFKEIHWSVIEILLQKGLRVTVSVVDSSPFIVLKNFCYAKKILCLNHLVKYLELEKKYHPDSPSALSVDEFEFLTCWQRDGLTKILKTFSSNQGSFSRKFDMLNGIKNISTPAEAETDKKVLLEQVSESNVSTCSNLLTLLSCSLTCFRLLVKEGSLKDSLESWQCSGILSLVEKIPKESIDPALFPLLDACGFKVNWEEKENPLYGD